MKKWIIIFGIGMGLFALFLSMMLVAHYMSDTTQGKLCCIFGIFVGGICMGYIGTIGIQLIINPHRYSLSSNANKTGKHA